jgi:exopolysaccharide biosynthesis predicted pyruvyltransferase EpsI
MNPPHQANGASTIATESRLDRIARLQDMIHDCLKDCISADEPVAILDFPDIRNCGDSALWLGEMAWLRDRFGQRPAYVSRMHDFSSEDLARVMPTGPIFIHGGGDFGDLWPAHQDFRERVLECFPRRRIIQFPPQSVHHGPPERAEQSARIVGRHKHFVLLVRDEESRQFAGKHFDCEVRLCPDMAFCIGPLQPGPAEFPVLAMLRADRGKTGRLDGAACRDIPVEDWITERVGSVLIAETLGAASALLAAKPAEMRLRELDAAAHNRFGRGIRQISRGRAGNVEDFREAFRADKGRRVLKGMLRARDSRFFMIVDDDDFVSARIAQFVSENGGANGWIINHGYIWDHGGKLLLGHDDFNHICGTSLIVRADLYGLPENSSKPRSTGSKRCWAAITGSMRSSRSGAGRWRRCRFAAPFTASPTRARTARRPTCCAVFFCTGARSSGQDNSCAISASSGWSGRRPGANFSAAPGTGSPDAIAGGEGANPVLCDRRSGRWPVSSLFAPRGGAHFRICG